MNAVAACLLFLIAVMQLWSTTLPREMHNRPMTEDMMPKFKMLSVVMSGILIWAAVLLITP